MYCSTSLGLTLAALPYGSGVQYNDNDILFVTLRALFHLSIMKYEGNKLNSAVNHRRRLQVTKVRNTRVQSGCKSHEATSPSTADPRVVLKQIGP